MPERDGVYVHFPVLGGGHGFNCPVYWSLFSNIQSTVASFWDTLCISFTGCSGSGLFTGNTGNISRPAKIEQECTATGSFLPATAFTCYYQIVLDAAKNVSIQFSSFEFKYGNAADCSTGAWQYLEMYVDGGNIAVSR